MRPVNSTARQTPLPWMKALRQHYAAAVSGLSHADFLVPFLLRLYLAPIFWMAGWNKLSHFGDTVEWFGNSEWGLGLPWPTLMAGLATGTELLGAALLLTGLAVRFITVPLLFTMLVAMFSVHWPNGWLAVAEGEGLFATQRTMEAVERLTQARDILREHGNYEYLTEHGSLVMLNNGIEFGATYFLMLLTLLFTGAGRWLSLDFWIARIVSPHAASRHLTVAYR